MKKVLCFLVASLFLISVVPANAEVQSEFTEAEINERIKQIADSYDLYEPLNAEDAEFIKKYAIQPMDRGNIGVNGYKSSSFNETKYNSSGTVGVRASGTIWADIGVINNSYGGNFTSRAIKGSSRVDKIRNSIRHTAFGLIGSGGIGKVYDNSITNTCNSSICTTNSSKSYVASVAYARTWASSTVYYDNGSTLTVGSQ